MNRTEDCALVAKGNLNPGTRKEEKVRDDDYSIAVRTNFPISRYGHVEQQHIPRQHGQPLTGTHVPATF